MENQEKGVATEQTQEVVTYTTNDFETLRNNISKENYEIGKKAGYEMTVKEMKRAAAEKYGIETDGIKDMETLFEKVLSTKSETVEKEVTTKKQSEIEKLTNDFETIKSEKVKLQSLVEQIKSEYETKLQENETRFKKLSIDNKLNDVISTIPFEVPSYIADSGEDAIAKFINSEKSKLKALISNMYSFDLNENKIIATHNGEVIKDKLQNPVELNELFLNFAKENYFSLKSEKSVSQKEGKKYGTITGIKTKEDAMRYVENEGFDLRTNEGLIRLNEILKTLKT